MKNWFLVGNKFDNGQDIIWNIEDEPFSITPPYIIGDREFLEEVSDMLGNKFAKKLIKAIDKENYKEVLFQEKIKILYTIFGWTDSNTKVTNIINNLIVYKIII